MADKVFEFGNSRPLGNVFPASKAQLKKKKKKNQFHYLLLLHFIT